MFKLTRAKYITALASAETMETVLTEEHERLKQSCAVLQDNWFGLQSEKTLGMVKESEKSGSYAKALAHAHGMTTIMSEYLPEIEKLMAKREQIGKQLKQDAYQAPDLSYFREEELIIDYSYIDNVKADADGALHYGEAAIRILREMMAEAEQYAGEYLDLSEVEELLGEGERKLHRLENYRDEFVDFGKKMSDMEYNVSSDLSRIMAEQGDWQATLHVMGSTCIDQKTRTQQMTGEEDELIQAKYEAEIRAEIEAYWNRQDGYFEEGWWKDEEKKQEAINMLLLESLMTENEAGEPDGYNLMEHYVGTKIGSPKRYALQIMFQLEPTDGDDETILNNIAGACAKRGFDVQGNDWVIPPDIMQLHAVCYKKLQMECDNNEKELLSFMINFTPVVGEIKSIAEAMAGKDIITGEELTGVEKILGLAAGFADVLYLLNGLKGIKYADETVEVVRGIKGGTPTDLTIMSRNSGRGNPGAITHFDVDLNTRQKNLLQQLPNCDSSIIINKGDVNLKDLAALTAKTGDEFAMFTRGSQRMIIRGNASAVNIDGAMAQELYNAGFKWSGHTHPGIGVNVKFASEGDMYILEQFNQTQRVIFDSQGNFSVFEIGE